MQAIVYTRYGSPDVLTLTELDKPMPEADEILIRIRAASVNAADYHTLRGRPYLGRLTTGWPKPKNRRPGVDLAGQVEAVGNNVTRVKPGDEVFGASRGIFAEYICTPGKALALKPANIPFEQAAAIPVAALTAPQGLRDKGQLPPGQKVLINSASGMVIAVAANDLD